MRRYVFFALPCFVLLATSSAHGQVAPVAKTAPAANAPTDAKAAPISPARQKARALNASAARLFSLGMFAKAAELYQKAYVLAPAPGFLYNLGQCYRRIGGLEMLEKARFHFDSFVNNGKPGPLRNRARKLVTRLDRQITALKAERDRPPPIYKRWWFWTAIGVAVAGATTAVVIAAQPTDEKVVEGTLPPGILSTP